jgi:hypothetical protein
MCEICSTGTPDLLSRKGSAVQMKPMYMPKGRVSTPNAQGAGHWGYGGDVANFRARADEIGRHDVVIAGLNPAI